MFFGSGIYDVNSPYRLMKVSVFKKLYFKIPEYTFAPNILISGYVNRNKIKFYSTEIPFKFRTTGVVSIKSWKFIKVGFKTFRQVLSFILFNSTNT